jgi:hypothetical protein
MRRYESGIGCGAAGVGITHPTHSGGAAKTLLWRAERRHALEMVRDLHCMTRRLARHPLDFFEG